MVFYVYLLYSQIIDRYYIGYTGDTLDERIRKHNTNHKGFTGKTNDWGYKYVVKFETKKKAYACYYYIKSRKSKSHLEELIEEGSI